ncbi:MAG: Na+/H+ antiporter subunit E [Pseudomonadota bacterium]
MIRILILAIALLGAWLVWSGLYKSLLLMLGVLSVSLTLWLSRRMLLTDQNVFSLDLVPRLVGFWSKLLVDIVRSNFQVAGIIIRPRMPISPTMVTIESPTCGLVGQATIANSVTLTPGTLTVDAHEGVFKVHCLTRRGAAELAEASTGADVVRAIGER